MARARYGHSGPDWRPWFYLEGGGALFDLGVYNITCLTGWLGTRQAGDGNDRCGDSRAGGRR